jgi:hypothetical protein
LVAEVARVFATKRRISGQNPIRRPLPILTVYFRVSEVDSDDWLKKVSQVDDNPAKASLGSDWGGESRP